MAPLWLVTALLLALIWIYRLILSPILGALGAQCRFHPTCSVYAAEALRKYGLFVGSAKAAYRLLRCHPFCRGGHDPP
ncbi:MAG: membrane protein insertion efficiency factor YidD [Myxococcales bacterium]|nr:membrane protein insertion efficiency factor YidD [Myxococcales bacterium]